MIADLESQLAAAEADRDAAVKRAEEAATRYADEIVAAKGKTMAAERLAADLEERLARYEQLVDGLPLDAWEQVAKLPSERIGTATDAGQIIGTLVAAIRRLAAERAKAGANEARLRSVLEYCQRILNFEREHKTNDWTKARADIDAALSAPPSQASERVRDLEAFVSRIEEAANDWADNGGAWLAEAIYKALAKLDAARGVSK